MWYNQTSLSLRGVTALEAWSSGALMISPQRDGGYGQSTPSTASWAAGGVSATRNIVTTQEYNGSGWSSGGNLNTGREEGTGFGLVSASVLAGGATTPPALLKNEVEEYDGSTWTAGTALPASRKKAAGAGTQTTGLVSFGAVDPPSTAGSVNATALEYDGTSWTAGGTGNTARYQISGCGTQTAALAFGGNAPSYSGATEEYDGSTWTTSGAMNIARSLMGGSGIQTSALAYGGFTPYSAKTENYNGTSWSNSPELSTARDRLQGGGTDSSNAIAGGGLIGTSPYTVNLTEEFNKSISVITPAAWSSGGNYPTATADMGSAGTRTAGLIFSGETPAPALVSTTNEYDGSVFSSGGNVVSARSFITGFGLQTAAIGFGAAPAAIITTNTESYDGSTWTEVNNLSTARGNAGGAGIQTSGLGFGGYVTGGPPLNTNATEEWDGTSWTAGGNMNTARRALGGCGTQTAALAAAGVADSPLFTSNVEEYNGSTWSEVNNLPLARSSFRCVGTQTAALGTSGYLPGPAGGPGNLPTNSIVYDGTNWITNPNLATGNNRGGQAGATTSSFVTAGSLGSGITTENFDGETTATNVKTFTTS